MNLLMELKLNLLMVCSKYILSKLFLSNWVETDWKNRYSSQSNWYIRRIFSIFLIILQLLTLFVED